MSLSVNTNIGALMALQNIQGSTTDIAATQSRIATGLTVAGPKDNGALFQIATDLKADLAGHKAVGRGLVSATSLVDVSIAGAAVISDILIEMREKALHATDASLDKASRTSLQSDFDALLAQLDLVADNAVFNDLNLLNPEKGNNGKGHGKGLAKVKGDPGFGNIEVLLSPDGAVMTIAAQPMHADDLKIDSLSFDTRSQALDAVDAVSTAAESVTLSLAALGTDGRRLEIQTTLNSRLMDSMAAGIGNLVDADLSKEAAELTARQMRLDLGIHSLSIANAGASSILGLFKQGVPAT
jgi:flagellin